MSSRIWQLWSYSNQERKWLPKTRGASSNEEKMWRAAAASSTFFSAKIWGWGAIAPHQSHPCYYLHACLTWCPAYIQKTFMLFEIEIINFPWLVCNKYLPKAPKNNNRLSWSVWPPPPEAAPHLRPGHKTGAKNTTTQVGILVKVTYTLKNTIKDNTVPFFGP